MPNRTRRRIPEATVARLPVYLRSLLELAAERITTVSSERLAEMAGVNAAKVRKDLSYLGSYGTRGVGYDVEYLLFQMSRELGLTQDWPVVIVGVGNLGHALANYGGFGERGFPVAALVDADPAKVGDHHRRPRRPPPRRPPRPGRRATTSPSASSPRPASAAQDVADRLVEAGVTSILNFAPSLIVSARRRVAAQGRPAVELQILSFYQQRRLARPSHGRRRRAGRRPSTR